MFKYLIISSLFLSIHYFVCLGQEDCTQTLSKAQKLYDAGNIEQIPSMLKPCIEKGFSAEEKQQAQKLIVLSYLFDKNTVEAEKALFEFLKKNPEYIISNSDQAEFVQLFESYRTLPVFSIGFSGGLNYSLISTGLIYGSSKSKGTYTSPTAGFQGGISMRAYLFEKIDINLEANYLQSSFHFNNPSVTDGNSLDVDETQTGVSIPVSFIFTPFQFKKFNPFIRLGGSFNYLLSSKASLVRQPETSLKAVTGPDISLIDNRSKYNIQALGGIGMTYNLKHSFLMLEVRYNHGFMSQTLKKTGIDAPNQDLWSLYYWVENDFALSNLFVNVGIFYKFYKPRKK